jgi:hypothetical protein
LLRLRISCALLVGCIILLLRFRFFLCIFLLLVVGNCPGGTDNHRRAYRGTRYTSSDHPSSHHFDLLINISIEIGLTQWSEKGVFGRALPAQIPPISPSTS